MAAEITKVTFRFGLIVDQICRTLEVSPDEINAEGVSDFPDTEPFEAYVFGINSKGILIGKYLLTLMSQAWVYCAHGTELKEAQQAVAEFNAAKVSS